jgi:hypothetical protein
MVQSEVARSLRAVGKGWAGATASRGWSHPLYGITRGISLALADLLPWKGRS